MFNQLSGGPEPAAGIMRSIRHGIAVGAGAVAACVTRRAYLARMA